MINFMANVKENSGINEARLRCVKKIFNDELCKMPNID